MEHAKLCLNDTATSVLLCLNSVLEVACECYAHRLLTGSFEEFVEQAEL